MQPTLTQYIFRVHYSNKHLTHLINIKGGKLECVGRGEGLGVLGQEIVQVILEVEVLGLFHQLLCRLLQRVTRVQLRLPVGNGQTLERLVIVKVHELRERTSSEQSWLTLGLGVPYTAYGIPIVIHSTFF